MTATRPSGRALFGAVAVIELRHSELVSYGSARNNNCSKLHKSENRPSAKPIKDDAQATTTYPTTQSPLTAIRNVRRP